jgi:hypothetical protein
MSSLPGSLEPPVPIRAPAFRKALFALSEDVQTSRAANPTVMRTFCESSAPRRIAVRQSLIPYLTRTEPKIVPLVPGSK